MIFIVMSVFCHQWPSFGFGFKISHFVFEEKKKKKLLWVLYISILITQAKHFLSFLALTRLTFWHEATDTFSYRNTFNMFRALSLSKKSNNVVEQCILFVSFANTSGRKTGFVGINVDFITFQITFPYIFSMYCKNTWFLNTFFFIFQFNAY